jgi:GNAT superfamily N-acetyltransferase
MSENEHMGTEVRIAGTDAEITACFPVIRALRPHLTEAQFVPLIRRMEAGGYRLAYLSEDERPVVVAGFRTGENLPWGRFMYVDDLVTDPAYRSRGFGRVMLDWLKQYAAESGCEQLRLDSGVQRKDAHRFYEREGMEMASLHFLFRIEP